MVNLPNTLVFDYPSVAAISGFIAEKLGASAPTAAQAQGALGDPNIAAARKPLSSRQLRQQPIGGPGPVYILGSAQRTPGIEAVSFAVAGAQATSPSHSLHAWSIDRASAIPYNRWAAEVQRQHKC